MAPSTSIYFPRDREMTASWGACALHPAYCAPLMTRTPRADSPAVGVENLLTELVQHYRGHPGREATSCATVHPPVLPRIRNVRFTHVLILMLATRSRASTEVVAFAPMEVVKVREKEAASARENWMRAESAAAGRRKISEKRIQAAVIIQVYLYRTSDLRVDRTPSDMH